MSDPLRIDAHQHFWDIESGGYTWPTPKDGEIFRTFTPDDLEPELRPVRIDATVLVHADQPTERNGGFARWSRTNVRSAVLGDTAVRVYGMSDNDR